MIGIYHNKDLDGFTSGAIIKLKYPDAKMYGHDYGLVFDVHIDNEPVIMADISLPMDEMLEVSKKSNWQFTWIDHHISAIKEYKKITSNNNSSFCEAVLEDGISACEGSWKYLFPGIEMPIAVRLLGEYDTWRNQDKQRWENEILPFQYGMRLICNSLESFPMEVLGINYQKEDIFKIIEDGKTVLKYQRQTNQLLCERTSFEADFNGLKAICLNGGGLNSNSFDGFYDEKKHDIMIPFQYDGGKWKISLYTTKENVDCSSIAKENGGGGHKKAAGFETKDISKIFPSIKN